MGRQTTDVILTIIREGEGIVLYLDVYGTRPLVVDAYDFSLPVDHQNHATLIILILLFPTVLGKGIQSNVIIIIVGLLLSLLFARCFGFYL